MSFIPTISPVPPVAPKAAAAPAEPKAKSGDDFAALLDSSASAANEPAAPAASEPTRSADDTSAPTDHAAAPVEDTAPTPETGDEPRKDDGKDLLSNLLDLLSQLASAVQNNQPLDPALVDKVNSALSAFSNYLGVDLNSGVPAGLPGQGGVSFDPASLLGQLTQKAGGLGEALNNLSPDLAKKLAALEQNLTSGGVSADTLAKLGFKPEAAPEPAPQLAAPELKLPEATFTKTAESPSAPKAADMAVQKPADAAPAEPKAAPAEKHAEKTTETAPVADRKTEDKSKAAAAQAPADKPGDTPQLPGATTMARIEVIGGVRAVQAAYQAPPTQVNIPQLAFDISRHVQAGNTKFHIRLDPPELGRIDVRMDVDQTGNVTTRLTVEKSETLDLLQRDQRSLEKALAQAGLEGGKTSLEFSLRQNSSNQRDAQGDGGRSPFGSGSGPAANDDAGAADPTLTQYRGTATAGGLNLFV